MSNSYYENGAIHNDHHRELHIDKVNGNDLHKLISAFFKDDAEKIEVTEEVENIPADETGVELPKELASEEAMKYWSLLIQKGFVDANYHLQPHTTRKQAMYIADVFSDKLKLKVKWKPFQELWHINNLAQEKWEMQETGKSPIRSEEIDKIFED